MEIERNIEDIGIINKYLCEIKKNLPFSIRIRKDETNCILEEIEDHIWEKVIENIGNRDPRTEDVEFALSEMGSPIDIAKGFSIRSTPFLYISEGFFPIYLRWSKILFGFFLLSIFILSGYFPLFRIIIFIFIYMLLLVNFIFFYLSSKGYLPGDLRRIYFRNKKEKDELGSQRKIKNPIKRKRLILWAFLWLINFTALLIGYLLDPNNFNQPYTLGGLIVFVILIVIDVSRYIINSKLVREQQFLLILKTVILFLYFLFPMIFDPYSYSIFDQIHIIINNPSYIFYPIELLYILPYFVFFGFLYYNIYKVITFKEKFEKYLINLSLEKRYLKKQSYISSKVIKINENLEFPKKLNKEIKTKSRRFHEEKVKNLKNNIFIEKIRKKLPRWLTIEEKENFLIDISDRVQEIALEKSHEKEITEQGIEQVLKNLGIIKSMISEKKRSKPKIYISEELWIWFTFISKIIIFYSIFIAIYLKINELVFFTANEEIEQWFSYTSFIDSVIYFYNFFITLIVFLFFIFLLFIFLSMQDIIPSYKSRLTIKDKRTSKNLTVKALEISQSTIYVMFSIFVLFFYFQSSQFSVNLTFKIFLIFGTLNSLSIIKLIKLLKINLKNENNKTLSMVSVILNVFIILSISIALLDISSMDIYYLSKYLLFIKNFILTIQLVYELVFYFTFNLINNLKLSDFNKKK